ncbi:MAG: 30S ribosomal protein S17 [Phycisphaeraceae bacterium]|nr:30S ribosomal protein S17 [Phycisphaeraceae bacterium]MCB9847286.1 30S ribosomal protein S17 [Phycisphaeraceae bacterium]
MSASKNETPTGARVGIVESDKRDKTRRVTIHYVTKHPKYGKYIRQRTVLHVHDENNESRLGDRVEVAQCRPISKTKSWKLLRVVERAPDTI